MLKNVEAMSRIVNLWVENLVCLMGILMVSIVAFQVLCRYGLNHSLFWSEELARILLVWITFLGGSVAYHYKAHPGVDALYCRLPDKMKKISSLAVHVSAMALFGIMIVYGIRFAWFVRLQITPALAIPKWMVMGIVPASGLVFTIHCLAFIHREHGSSKGRS